HGEGFRITGEPGRRRRTPLAPRSDGKGRDPSAAPVGGAPTAGRAAGPTAESRRTPTRAPSLSRRPAGPARAGRVRPRRAAVRLQDPLPRAARGPPQLQVSL